MTLTGKVVGAEFNLQNASTIIVVEVEGVHKVRMSVEAVVTLAQPEAPAPPSPSPPEEQP